VSEQGEHRKLIKPLVLGILVIVVGGALLWVGWLRTKTGGDGATSEKISRILITSRPGGGGLARREFSPDGWVDGGHVSGDPERIYEEREQIPRKEIKAIWAAAAALGPEIHAMDVPPQPEWDGYMELLIFFDDQSTMRLSWPFREEYPDLRVQALVELLLAVDVGGW
jgi:hypothetical protein